MFRTRAFGAEASADRPRRIAGFTLVEIMVVIVILGVLAAVAIPAFVKYIRRAKTAEAYDKLALLYRGSATYITNSNEDVTRGTAGTSVSLRFPITAGPSPVGNCCSVPGDMCVPIPEVWDQDPWRNLDFQIADPHYFVYSYESDETGGRGSIFTARANGDLDCDGRMSTFERVGILASPGEVRSAPGIYQRLAGE